jgi:glycosyltransferase involved in cell wall biosynthesis
MTLDVTVVIPTYNQNPKYLAEAIESSLHQSYPREKYEILVVDDGSTQILPDSVVSQFKNENVRLIKKEHGGIAHTLNVGIRNMEGKYFKWLSSDDALCEDALEILMNKADERQIIYGDWMIIDENSRLLNVYHEPVFTGLTEMKRRLWRHFFANASTTLIPKSAFKKVGMFDDSLPYSEDYDWWLRSTFLYGYPFVHADGIVAKYRIHHGQLSVIARSKKKLVVEWYIKRRLYSVLNRTSSLIKVLNPSIDLMARWLLFHDIVLLYARAPERLRRLTRTLLDMKLTG